MPEQQNIEWKQSWRDEYLQWISGFANANGGVLYVGKDDNGNVVGVDKYKKLMDELPNKIKDTTGIVCDVNLHEENDNYFIEIAVESFSSPVSYKGKFYLRSGSTNQLLNSTALEDFLLKKKNLTWDAVTMDNASIEDINLEAVECFKKKAIDTGRLPSIGYDTDTETVLRKLELVNQSGRYTRAALLLFGKNPQRYYTTAYLKIGKFGNSPSDLITQDVVETNAFELADKTLELLNSKYIFRNIKYEGLSRKEPPEYPYDAIREILFNAIIHKKYGISPITVKVYNDRISISNFGELPESLTLDDLWKDHRSIPRNRLMANVFYKGGHIEAWGRGTLKIIEECKNYGLLEPLIEERQGGVTVTLFKDIYNEHYLSKLDLNERQVKAIRYIKENKVITNKTYREMFDITDRTVLRDIEELVEFKMFKKIGNGRATKYVINVEGYEY